MSDSPTLPMDSKVSSKRKLTPHPEYEDHAHRDEAWAKQRKQDLDVAAAKKSFGGAKETFPIKLHAMLMSLQEPDETAIIDWLPHGRAFKVHNRRRFEGVVLPKYFRYQSEYLSFQRQLNVYGFLRTTGQGRSGGADNNAYYHPLFLRGKPELVKLISRNRCAPHSTRRTFDAKTEPNFAAMSPMPNPPKHAPVARPVEQISAPSEFAEPLLAHFPCVEASAGSVLADPPPYTTARGSLLGNMGATQPASYVSGSSRPINPMPSQESDIPLGFSSQLFVAGSNEAMQQFAQYERDQRAVYPAEDTRSIHQYMSGLGNHMLPFETSSSARFPPQSLIDGMLSQTQPAPNYSHGDGTEPFAKRFRPNDAIPQMTFVGDGTTQPSHHMDVNSDWLETTDFNTFW